jgi:hypothetical protein
MPPSTGRLTRLLIPLLFLGACDHGVSRTTDLLNDRLQARLAPDITAGTAAIQPLPNGALVTLLGASQFPNNIDTLADKHREVRASVIEGLLDPSLIHIAVADTSTLPANQREARVRNVIEYFKANGLALSMLPEAATPAPAATAPQGVTLTVLLDCPAHQQPDNWNYLPPLPSCH